METFFRRERKERNAGRTNASGGRARGALRRGIVSRGKPEDAFGLGRIGRARDIVKSAGAESLPVSVPIGEMRKDNARGSAGCRRQNTNGGAKIAVRQLIAAEDTLKGVFLDKSTRVGQSNTIHGMQSHVAGDFFDLLTLEPIGRDDQHVAGAEHFAPPAPFATGQERETTPG